LRRRPLWSWLVGSGMLLVIACATVTLKGDQGSGRDQVGFSHQRHATAKIECITCHDDVYDAKTLEAVQLPKERKCLECHKEQKEKGNCSFCHSDVQFAGPFPKRSQGLQMSHASHIERIGEDCSRCHLKLPEPGQNDDLVPPMAVCTNCHQHQTEYAAGSCSGCHLDLSRFPLRPISDFSHQADFLRSHPRPARSNPESCYQCHEQNFCQDCHSSSLPVRLELRLPERVDRLFVHRGDYLGRHSIDARADEAMCRRCHGTSFCEGCHTRENLTPAASNPRNPHPAGWNLPGGRNFHGDAARRDINSCAACHDQGPNSNCVSCHRVGGIGGNPHPPGWTSHHPQSEIGHNSMCVICHI